MDNTQTTGHFVTDVIYAGVSLVFMIVGFLSLKSAHEYLQVASCVVSIAAGTMVFINNYRNNKKRK